MNDKYLYRAKRVDSGEWVAGSLITGVFFGMERNDIPYILCPEKADYDCFEDFTEDNGIFEVNPSTICQCTGFSDEDGKKIFEGDIVGFIDCASTENGYSEQCCRGQVEWDEETVSFQVTDRLSAESYEVLDRGCKVLGNIFDNPELMEEW